MVSSAVYDDVIQRIQGIYNSCSKAEQKQLMQILSEISDKGYSETLENVWLVDFKEVPVSIDEFICSGDYLGETNDMGASVYPFWKATLHDIFSQGNKYNEIILSGATRIGKTSTAVTIMAYMLYRLMLYRNPHKYFNKKAVSKFTLAFANITKELAEGVAFHEFQTTLQHSKWFYDRGTFTRSVSNPIYMPEGGMIEIIPVSDGAQALGKQVWCVIGDTMILTDEGVRSLAECADSSCNVAQLVGDDLIYTSAAVHLTKYTTETIRIELQDGSIIEGTPEHRVLLSDGSYKALGELSSSDDLLTLNDLKEVDKMNLSCYNKQFHVYEHISPRGKRYIGITSKDDPQERWAYGRGYKENNHFWAAIIKYGWENFEHNVIASGLTLAEACAMEQRLIQEYDTMNPEHGYNHTTGGNWSTPDQETRQKISESIKRNRQQHPEIVEKLSAVLKGHEVSEETRRRISESNRGRKMSEEFCEKQRARKHSPETLAKLRGHSSWCKGLTKETDARVKKISDTLSGRDLGPEWRANVSAARKAQYANGYCPVWINNGQIETSIQKGADIPEGFQLGRLSVRDTYIHKGTDSKKIMRSELDEYLSQGWELGRPDNVGLNIKKGQQKYYWMYEGMKFDFTCDLIEYLHLNGYPNIVASTLTALYNNGFASSPSYGSLEGKIQKITL